MLTRHVKQGRLLLEIEKSRYFAFLEYEMRHNFPVNILKVRTEAWIFRSYRDMKNYGTKKGYVDLQTNAGRSLGCKYGYGRLCRFSLCYRFIWRYAG